MLQELCLVGQGEGELLVHVLRRLHETGGERGVLQKQHLVCIVHVCNHRVDIGRQLVVTCAVQRSKNKCQHNRGKVKHGGER